MRLEDWHGRYLGMKAMKMISYQEATKEPYDRLAVFLEACGGPEGCCDALDCFIDIMLGAPAGMERARACE